MITVYRTVFEKTGGSFIEINKVLEYIKTGRWQTKIHELRNCTEKADKARCKNYLPSVCFSGTFNERFDTGIIQHSGFCVLDFDHVPNLIEFKENICKDEYTYSAFISPSGDGLKLIVKIPAEIENHEAYYLGLINKYPSVDTTSRNISRVCFVSYDPELYLNENSLIFTTKGELKETKINVPVKIDAINTDYNKLNTIVEMIRFSTEGNKHKDLIKASRLAGGFISGGLVEEYEAVRLLELEINRKDITDFKGACKTIQDGIEYGKREPIYEKTYAIRMQEMIKQDIIILEEPAKDVIYLDDVRDKILYSYQHGTSRGETTHFSEIDKRFRWKRGDLTMMHGIGNHGKSSLMYQMALMKSVMDGYKWGVFSPENMPEEEFYKDLIHPYIGKSTEKHHKNQMSMDELEKGMDFIKEHFYLIYPETEAPTPEYINNRFKELLIKHKIDGCIIDPYNQLDNDINKNGGREDQYLSHFLTTNKRFAVEQKLFYVIITHPKGGILKKGLDYECPTVFDVAGGPMWNNKLDNILVTHRPFYNSDPENTSVIFKSQKIKKQKLNGIPGEVELTFDRLTARYYQLVGQLNPLVPEQLVNRLNPLPVNENFENEQEIILNQNVPLPF